MKIELYFSDYYGVDASVLQGYGAFNPSLVSDLPLFIDPSVAACPGTGGTDMSASTRGATAASARATVAGPDPTGSPRGSSPRTVYGLPRSCQLSSRTSTSKCFAASRMLAKARSRSASLTSCT
jgi:hypothetical protein